ncbi:tetratricopeptide repeat family [Cystobacter fuscus DSM 2262]|uniref:Tetratricopeptide repeat family n=1 Tax=Cystobacter fuscus (strain ATCC 25194 / DSM 2262 / NBRC 100088 / M29) TaxID=1242864 RepID=S9NZD4_CYSF2|nr:tetratricopeptide repeat protein [Cystobacter fuscus]EPX57560.1 tetratricopeptide repeat family [Cystobacter fuscus DSM 2262]
MESLNQLLAAGRFKEASEQATKRVTQKPGDTEALIALARVAVASGENEKAEQLLTRADPSGKGSDPEVLLARATLAMRRQQWEKAWEFYRPLVETPTPRVEALYGLGIALCALGEPLKACAALDDAMQLAPTHPDIRYELGRAYMLYGNQVEAGYHFIRGLRLNPKDERGYHAVAYLASGRGKRRSARRVLELGLKQVPGSKLLRDALQSLTEAPSAKDTPEAREQRAVFEQASEMVKGLRTREALELMKAAYKRGMRATVWLKLLEAEACERQKSPDFAGALRAYEEALVLDPKDWVAHNNMALFLLRQRGPDALERAIKALEQAHDCAPQEPEPVLNLAISYAKARQKEKAQELARRLVDNLPAQHPFVPAAQALLGNGAPRPSLWKVKSTKGK